MKIIKLLTPHYSLLWSIYLFFFLVSCRSAESLVTPQKVAVKPSITTNLRRLDLETTGINRLAEYTVVHRDIPQDFDGKTILFISDLHYPSLFAKEDIYKLSSYLSTLDYDILCLGGDYHEDITLIDTLFDELGKHVPALGAFAVMGNNDYERGYEQVVEAMKRNNIQLLEHEVAQIGINREKLFIVGVRNPFDLTKNGVSPSLDMKANNFVILLTHTPDYAEDVAIGSTDLVLAGHTHGGQVRIFGVAPIVPSKYDQRFLSGLVYNSDKIPMLVTNGIGTSNKKVRMGAPSEVMLIHLKRASY